MHPKKIVNHVCDPTPLCNISCCKFVDHCLPDLAWSSPSLLITSTIPRFCDAMIISTTTCLGTSPYLGAYTTKKKSSPELAVAISRKIKINTSFVLKNLFGTVLHVCISVSQDCLDIQHLVSTAKTEESVSIFQQFLLILRSCGCICAMRVVYSMISKH